MSKLNIPVGKKTDVLTETNGFLTRLGFHQKRWYHWKAFGVNNSKKIIF